MAIFSKPDGFVKQIAIYLDSGNYQDAYGLALEMTKSFPGEMISHFLLAKSSLRLGRYEEALKEGLIAFNMSSGRKDLLASSLVLATAYFMLGRFQDGAKLLSQFESDGSEDVEKLDVIFAAAMGDEKAAEKHVRMLMKLNKKAAEEMIERFLIGK